MKKGRMSESGFLGLKDKQDLTTKKIFKSSNLVNPDSDNRKGWEECNLEDHIKLIDYRGRTPVKTESGVRLITAKNVKLGYLQLEPQEFIAADNYDNWMSRGIPNYGDVIFTTEAPLANVAQIDTNEKLAFAQRIIVMQPNSKKIDQAFLKLMLLSENTRQKILEKGTGATVTGIKSSLLKKIRISFPPLSEQQRIVGILDEAFAAIAKAKANAQQNLQNAKELFESYLQGVFENKMSESGFLGLKDEQDLDVKKSNKRILKSSNLANPDSDKGEGWEEKTLGECFRLKSGDGLTSKMMSDDGNYPVFGGNGIAGLHNEFNLSGSNVIVGRVGALCGNVRHITEKIWLTDNAFKIVDMNYEFDDSFLTYLLNFKVLRGYARQAAQPVISNSSLKDVVLNFPKSLKTQQAIVQKLDALSAETKKLESIYQQKIKDLEELKKSVLQKAFSGELKTVRGEV
jgi:type I restriction enzyme S subunit